MHPDGRVYPCVLGRPPPGWTVLAGVLLWLLLHPSSLGLLLLTTYLPSLGIKTCSSLGTESLFEVLLAISAYIHDVFHWGYSAGYFAFHLLWSQCTHKPLTSLMLPKPEMSPVTWP